MSSMHEIFGEVIHTYTRRQALADGVLVAIENQLAREAGFRCPVHLTAAAYANVIAWGEAQEQAKPGACQDETGRTWDMLSMLKLEISRHRSTGAGHRMPFSVLRVPATGRATTPKRADLVAVYGPDENYTPTITVMLPHED